MTTVTANDNEYPIVKTLTEALVPPLRDDVSASEIYYGWAPIGTAEDAPGWKIMRVKKTSTVTKSEFPDSKQDYAFKWSDRLTLTYSR